MTAAGRTGRAFALATVLIDMVGIGLIVPPTLTAFASRAVPDDPRGEVWGLWAVSRASPPSPGHS